MRFRRRDLRFGVKRGGECRAVWPPLYADRYPKQVAGMVLVDPPLPNDEQPPAETKALERAVDQGHDRLASMSTIGVNVVVHHTGHDIQIERPSAVISAIDKVLGQARHE